MADEATSTEAPTQEQKVSVSVPALRELLVALNGPGHLIRELQVLSGSTIPGINDPIGKLTQEFSEWVERANEGTTFYGKLTTAFPGFLNDEEVNGGDLVNWINANKEALKAL